MSKPLLCRLGWHRHRKYDRKTHEATTCRRFGDQCYIHRGVGGLVYVVTCLECGHTWEADWID